MTEGIARGRALTSKTDYQEFRGSRVSNVPDSPGLYAWYYRPVVVTRDTTITTLGKFFAPESRVRTVVNQRYGLKLISETMGSLTLGSDNQPITDAIERVFDDAEPFLRWFFSTPQFVQFCRPVYIGIAKNLYDRVYNQHFVSLTQYWDTSSSISRFLSANRSVTVQQAMDTLDLPHSFALEARVRGMPSHDLMVSVLMTDEMPDIGSDTINSTESNTRRSLERFLQLLADPICGRR